MDCSRIEEMLSKKAEKVGFNNLELHVIPEEKRCINWMELEIYDGCLLLSLNDNGLLEDDFERFLEYQLCELYLKDRGMVEEKTALPQRFTLNEYLANQMMAAYSHYVTGKFFIEKFGRARFLELINPEVSNGAIIASKELKKTDDVNVLLLYIFSLYKDQIRADLAGINVAEMPEAVRLIAQPFPRIFDAIHKSGIDLEQKEAVVFAIGLEHMTMVDIPRTYLSDNLLLVPKWGCGISQMNAFEGCFNPKGYDTALHALRIMDEEYKKTGIQRSYVMHPSAN